MDCSKQRGPCSEKAPPAPPPCPPPPKPPFPWIYVWPWVLFFTIMGTDKGDTYASRAFHIATPAEKGTTELAYRLYLWKEERDRLSESKPVWRPRPKVRRPFHDQDLPPCVQYLIVGSGPAGWSAYQTIMAHHPKAKVFIITKEDILPYMRFHMSKNMWFNKEPPDPKQLVYTEDGARKSMLLMPCRKFMDPVKFYRKETGPALSIASGWCVLRVDPEEHVIYIKTLCGERPMYYEKLLLATGSRPKNLTAFKTAPKKVRDKVTTMRTIRDFEIAFRRVKAAKHVTIIGGGSLGSELAWYMGKMNQLVKEDNPEAETPELLHMIKDKGILPGVIPEYLGEWALEKIKNEGVKVMTKTQVHDAFVTKDDRLQLTLSNGSSLITDYVIVAVGSSPRTEIAERSNLEVDSINGGFLVNTEMQARRDVFVAGDAASLYTEWKDTRIRFEHYSTAAETGHVAGVNMTGDWDVANMEPGFRFTLGKVIDMEVVGEVGACMPTVALFKPCEDAEEDPADVPAVKLAPPPSSAPGKDKPCYKKTTEYRNRYKRGLIFYLRDEYVVGMVFWNIPAVDDRRKAVSEMLRARPTYKDINLLAEVVGFTDTQCVYASAEAYKEIGPCIKNFKVW